MVFGWLLLLIYGLLDQSSGIEFSRDYGDDYAFETAFDVQQEPATADEVGVRPSLLVGGEFARTKRNPNCSSGVVAGGLTLPNETLLVCTDPTLQSYGVLILVRRLMPPLDILLFVAIGFSFGTLFGWVVGHGFPRRSHQTIGGQI